MFLANSPLFDVMTVNEANTLTRRMIETESPAAQVHLAFQELYHRAADAEELRESGNYLALA